MVLQLSMNICSSYSGVPNQLMADLMFLLPDVHILLYCSSLCFLLSFTHVLYRSAPCIKRRPHRSVRVVKAETIVGHVPRDVTHILALHYAWWERRMRGNGKEDARRMRDNGKEDARKMGGADKRGGAHSRYQFFRCGKIGGGADKRWGAL